MSYRREDDHFSVDVDQGPLDLQRDHQHGGTESQTWPLLATIQTGAV